MTLAEYEAILIDLVTRNVITGDEAAELLRRFMAGEFTEESLPIPLRDATQEDNDAWLLLFLAFRSRPRSRYALRERKRLLAEIRSEFEKRTVVNVSQRVGGKSVRDWHKDAAEIVGGAMLAAWLAGNGTSDAQPAIDAQVNAQVNEQLSYLYRFAADQHAREQAGRPITELGLLNRAMMYAGAVRGAFYRGNESVDFERGWVSRYIPVDDRRTCSPCRRARGYYLPGDGPYPGEVCFGGWLCRCDRILIYAPDIYEQLTGIAIQA